MSPSSDRLEQIADMYAKHDDELHRLVRSRQFGHGHISPLVVDDACSFAWTQLLTHDYVNLGPPRWRALAWLTTCAVHEAWRLHRIEYRAAPIVNATVDAITAERDTGAPSAAELAEQHARLELVKQIPERPRRFLLRLALGYTYDEIAAAEGASYTTVNKQIARAKRLLRSLEQADAERTE